VPLTGLYGVQAAQDINLVLDGLKTQGGGLIEGGWLENSCHFDLSWQKTKGRVRALSVKGSRG